MMSWSSEETAAATFRGVLLPVFEEYLLPPDLGNCLLVSRGWNRVISQHILADPDKRDRIWSRFLKHAWLRGEPKERKGKIVLYMVVRFYVSWKELIVPII